MTFQQKLRSEKNQAKSSASLSQFIPSSFFRFGFFCIISIQIFKLYKRGEKVHLRFSSSFWDIQNLMSDLGFAGAVLSIVIHVDMRQVKIWADHVKIIFPWPFLVVSMQLVSHCQFWWGANIALRSQSKDIWTSFEVLSVWNITLQFICQISLSNIFVNFWWQTGEKGTFDTQQLLPIPSCSKIAILKEWP